MHTLIRKVQFDPIEHKRKQEAKKTYISTTAYTVKFDDTSNKDTTPKEGSGIPASSLY